ncbi:hypothetical protein Actkin_00845 [Actinokineospora sp. UTMC 2448]|nr:hypothetical protein Actkin_00845 [Actinokineospora sp. UTMC 2448]
MRISATVLAAVLLGLVSAVPAAAQGEKVTIAVTPLEPVEVTTPGPVEFTVHLHRHTFHPVDVALVINKGDLDVTAEGCAEDETGHLTCARTLDGSDSITLTVYPPDEEPEYDTYYSLYAWAFTLEDGSPEATGTIVAATIVLPGYNPFPREVEPSSREGAVPVIEGRVVDSVTGRPVGNATIRIRNDWMDATAHSDGEGRYRFTQTSDGPLPSGTYAMTVDAVGYRDYRAEVETGADQAAVHRVVLVADVPPPAPERPGTPVAVWIAVAAGAVGVLLVLAAPVVARRSARAQFQGLAAVPAVLGQDVHVGAAGGAVAEAAGHQVVTTTAAGEQGPETSALHVGEAVSTHADIHADAEDQSKPLP